MNVSMCTNELVMAMKNYEAYGDFCLVYQSSNLSTQQAKKLNS